MTSFCARIDKMGIKYYFKVLKYSSIFFSSTLITQNVIHSPKQKTSIGVRKERKPVHLRISRCTSNSLRYLPAILYFPLALYIHSTLNCCWVLSLFVPSKNKRSCLVTAWWCVHERNVKRFFFFVGFSFRRRGLKNGGTYMARVTYR